MAAREGQRCERCEHWEGRTSKCHRYPPQKETSGRGVTHDFPRASYDEWCGEFVLSREAMLADRLREQYDGEAGRVKAPGSNKKSPRV